MFLPHCKDKERRLALFLPVTCLLFQLRYEEALNWTTACLQHLPCIFFSFLAILLLQRVSRNAQLLSVMSLILAIGSSGNGFVAAVVGVLILASGRRFVHLLSWIAVTACCATAYAYKWTPRNFAGRTSLPNAAQHLRPDYVLLFIGSIAARPNLLAGTILGALILTLIAYFIYRGYAARNPAVVWCVLYLLLTAVGVAGLREDVDPVQISTSRYTIYSALFLIFCWFAAAESLLEPDPAPVRRRPLFLVVSTFTALFTATTWYTGLHGLKKHNDQMVQGMKDFEHPSTPESIAGPVIPLENQNAELDAFDVRARAALVSAIRSGIYLPPSF